MMKKNARPVYSGKTYGSIQTLRALLAEQSLCKHDKVHYLNRPETSCTHSTAHLGLNKNNVITNIVKAHQNQ